MEETDDSVTAPVRRTRSAAAKTTPKTIPKSQRPKPLSKKTKKKVVMMEVEVSDDEDESVGENEEKKESNDESSSPEKEKNSEEDLKDEAEKLEVNGKGSNDSKINEDPEVVINDVGMIAEDTNIQAEEKKDINESIEKMEVDEDENFKTDSDNAKKEKESVAEKTPSKLTTEKTANESPTKKTADTLTLNKETESSDEPKTKKPKLEEVSKEVEETGEKLKDIVKPNKSEEKAIVDKAEDQVINEKETKPEPAAEKQKPVENEETKISEEKQKPVENEETKISEEKQKPAEKEGTQITEEEQKPVEKEGTEKSEEKQKPVEKEEIEKSEEKQKPAVKEGIQIPEEKQEPVKKEETEKSEANQKPIEKEGIQISEEKTAEKAVTEISDEKSKDKQNAVEKEATEVSDEKAEDKQKAVEKEATEISEDKQKPVEKEATEISEDKKKDVEKEATEISDEKSEEKQKPVEMEVTETSDVKAKEAKADNQSADPDAENISEDELPTVQAAKVPEAEEVSDEELPGPKRAELPADTEVVSEDELPTVKNEGKKESAKRKLNETDYDPGSPTSESEGPAKKPALDASAEKEKEEAKKPKKLPELDKYWKAVNDDPTDFTGWTYLLQYVDQENDMEAAREAYDAFLSHYPYCYGYWRKYADYEKRKGNKKKCEEVFERGLKAIPLSVDLWIHYLTYVKTTRTEDEEFIRSQFERALAACGLEFRSDRLWDSYIKWETEGKRLQKVTCIYDRLLTTPTQGYTSHFDNFQEHISTNPPNKVIEVDEFLALRKEVRQILKHDVSDAPPADSDAPPGDEDQTKVVSSDEETKSIRERIVSIRRKIHKSTVNAVTARWNYEEGIKRPYFHVKPLERCQLKNWQDYLDYETEQGEKVRIIVLFERCLIACALYEEFWLKFVHYLESLKDTELQTKIRDVYERACTIHHLKKPNLHLQWAMFEEGVGNAARAAEILVNLEKSVPNVLQIAYRRINLERRRGEHEKCTQLYEHYINNSKNKMISSSISIKYSRFCYVIVKDITKAQEILKSAITKDPNNPRLYLQLIDLTLQKENVTEKEIIDIIDMFLEKDSTEPEQKVLFSQRKLEYLEDFGSDIYSVQTAHEQYQKFLKANKEGMKKKEAKSNAPSTEVTAATSKSVKDKPAPPSSSTSGAYGNYGQYGNSAQPNYPYSGNQQGPNYYPQYGQGDQYQYQNWQYPQGGYGGYNQWGGYSGGL